MEACARCSCHLLLIFSALELAGLFVTRQLVRVDHRKHLGEALAHTSDALSRITVGHLTPWHEVHFLAIKVGEPLFAGGARVTDLGEHCFLFV